MPEEVVDLLRDEEASRFQATIISSGVPDFTPVELLRVLNKTVLVFPGVLMKKTKKNLKAIKKAVSGRDQECWNNWFDEEYMPVYSEAGEEIS